MKTLFVFTLLFFLCMSFSDGSRSRVQVRVMNRRGNGKTVEIHCQSGDDDLGNHVVPDGQEVNFSFRESFLENTRFWCDVQWSNEVKYHFDAYWSDRDRLGRCLSQCLWTMMEDGLYGYDQEKQVWELVHLAVKG
uniref:S-protein homolog n=1 Tax=Papaver nudicaule TaxID=74823 RepID=O65866_PAPNU|nr:self-incompatibility [Papaver nudicaule]